MHGHMNVKFVATDISEERPASISSVQEPWKWKQ